MRPLPLKNFSALTNEQAAELIARAMGRDSNIANDWMVSIQTDGDTEMLIHCETGIETGLKIEMMVYATGAMSLSSYHNGDRIDQTHLIHCAAVTDYLDSIEVDCRGLLIPMPIL